MIRTIFLGLAALLLAGEAALSAQTASLALDVNTENGVSGNSFGGLTPVQGKLFFVASSPYANVSGQIWVTDGSAEGTRSLMEACPRDCFAGGSLVGGLGENLLFTVGPSFAERLWRSDGTPEGTFVLHPDLRVYLPPRGEDGSWVFFQGAMYFSACTQDSGCDVWKTNGTVAGTVLLKDVGQGLSPGLVEVVGERLYFTVVNEDDEVWLWSSDGTAAGTAPLKPLGEGFAEWLIGMDGKLFLGLHNDKEHKAELWVSNGTTAGTQIVCSFPLTVLPFWGTVRTAGGRLYFLADDGVYDHEVWVTDGTAKGTRRVSSFGPSLPFFDQLTAIGNRVVFLAEDGLHGRQLWTTAGTPESTAALPLPSCESCGLASANLVTAGDRALFSFNDGIHGREPWVTDGTVAGTRLLADLCPGTCDSLEPYGTPFLPTSLGIVFTAVDPTHGKELWLTDGTAAGTVRRSNLGVSGDATGAVAVMGSRIYFGASDGFRETLWVSDGPASSRFMVLPGPQASSSWPGDLAAVGDRLVFVADEGLNSRLYASQGTPDTSAAIGMDTVDGRLSSWETTPVGNLAFLRRKTSRDPGRLWRTDGTEAGTEWLGVSSSAGLTEWQGKLFFPYLDSATDDLEIWSSDGTDAGTVEVLELPRESSYYALGHLTGLGPELYFTVDNEFSESVRQIWRTDGTSAGTRKLTEIANSNAEKAPEFVRAGSFVFFLGRFGELWKTDGTPEGTTRLLELAPDGRELLATELTAFQGSLYFFARTTGAHRALWRSDGTAAGTLPLKEFSVLDSDYVPAPSLVAGGGRLWFAANDGVHGTELWASDGTAAGTSQVRDIFPGAEDSFPHRAEKSDSSAPLFIAGRLFFAANDGQHGLELWQSDGTAAGTRMVQDINPFASSSLPEQLTIAGNRLYFVADDGTTGREVWSLPLGEAPCLPGGFVLCLNGGRFRVEARWRDFQGNSGSAHAVSLSGDTGYFWFFDPANVELILKVLDGQSLNQHHWVFYGALSSVEYVITVTDTQTGLTRQYINPPGQLASVGDTKGFGPLGAHSTLGPTVSSASPPALRRTGANATVTPCQPSPERLCLRDGRFAVEATWKDFQGKTGKGTAVSLTGDTGYFWFFDASNVEVVLKVLDGTAVNGKHWVFYGALSNVEYTITVTDTQTGQQNTYTNPSGRFASVADTGAF